MKGSDTSCALACWLHDAIRDWKGGQARSSVVFENLLATPYPPLLLIMIPDMTWNSYFARDTNDSVETLARPYAGDSVHLANSA